MQSCFSEAEENCRLHSLPGASCQNWEERRSMVYLWLRLCLQVGFAYCERKICMRVVAYVSCRPSCLVNLRLQCNFAFQFYFYAPLNDKTRTFF